MLTMIFPVFVCLVLAHNAHAVASVSNRQMNPPYQPSFLDQPTSDFQPSNEISASSSSVQLATDYGYSNNNLNSPYSVLGYGSEPGYGSNYAGSSYGSNYAGTSYGSNYGTDYDTNYGLNNGANFAAPNIGQSYNQGFNYPQNQPLYVPTPCADLGE